MITATYVLSRDPAEHGFIKGWRDSATSIEYISAQDATMNTNYCQYICQISYLLCERACQEARMVEFSSTSPGVERHFSHVTCDDGV